MVAWFSSTNHGEVFNWATFLHNVDHGFVLKGARIDREDARGWVHKDVHSVLSAVFSHTSRLTLSGKTRDHLLNLSCSWAMLCRSRHEVTFGFAFCNVWRRVLLLLRRACPAAINGRLVKFVHVVILAQGIFNKLVGVKGTVG